MAKFAYIQNNFLEGEWSKQAQGRSNEEAYPRAAEEIRNALPLVAGGVTKRPGSRFVLDIHAMMLDVLPDTPTLGEPEPLAEDISNYTNIKTIPFVFNKEESYEVILVSNDLDPNNANRQAYLFVYDPEADDVVHSMSIVLSPVLNCNIVDTQYAQSGDVMWLANAGFRYFPLMRFGGPGNYTWNVPIFPDYIQPSKMPFMNSNANDNWKISASATTGTVTLTSNFNYFDPNMVGSYLRFSDSGTTGYVNITTVTDETSGTATVFSTLPSAVTAGSGISDWALQAFNDYNGYPQAVTFYQERLVLGGSRAQPDTSYFSGLDSQYNFNHLDVAIPDGSSPFPFTVASGEPNRICWYSPGKVLNMGTRGREFLVRSGSTQNPGIAYNNITASAETSFGSLVVQPERVDNSPVFVDRSGYILREFTYNFSEDAYNSRDLLDRADHLPKLSINYFDTYESAISMMAFQSYSSVLWCIDTNGGLFSVTRDRQAGVIGGARHVLGGSLNGGVCKVLSINKLPSVDGNFDEIYLAVQRTINGEDKFYLERIGIEYLGKEIFNPDTSEPELSKPYYSDSSVYRHNSPASQTVAGLEHLEGETVTVWADGHYDGEYVVSGGEITLDKEAEHIVVGLPYRTVIKPLELEAGSRIGTSIAAVKRIHKVYFKFVRTIGCKYGISENNLYEIQFRPEDLPMDQPIPMFTGTIGEDLTGNYESYEVPVIVHDMPTPFTISCIIMHGVTYD